MIAPPSAAFVYEEYALFAINVEETMDIASELWRQKETKLLGKKTYFNSSYSIPGQICQKQHHPNHP
jgi:hypothetical protein